jgi:two-component system C4-dicarboxylate transport sensor histidine kinase DctB
MNTNTRRVRTNGAMADSGGRRRAIVVLAVAGMVMFSAAVLVATWVVSRDTAVERLINRSRDNLQLYVANLQTTLEKYEYLPSLLAENQQIRALLLYPDDYASWVDVNRHLELVARLSGASDVYLLDETALTIAASNWREPITFIGDVYDFRPYYQQAMEQGQGRFYALGWASGKRGYYFSSAVTAHGEIIGVVVVKVAMESLEAERGGRDHEFAVVDPSGVIFLSSQPQWHYHTLRPLNEEERHRIRDHQRYGDHALVPLPVQSAEPVGNGATRISLAGGKTYISQALAMPEAGWTVHIFTDVGSVAAQALRAVILAAFALCVLALGAVIVAGRRAQAAALRRAHGRLEQRVAERTADLTESNRRLTREIAEHRRTEVALRDTRDQLVQAAKLATIGELSAGINHELSQPLTAIRSYADNARTLLDRARLNEVRDNLEQIGALTERMGRIINQLKLFVRKSAGTTEPVSLPAVVDGALALLAPRLRRSTATIDVRMPDGNIVVLGDMIRLEQVFVNLIGNALQALDGVAMPRVVISAYRCGDRVIATVRDNGPGIPEADLHSVFNAFVTTKQAGEGLGLGLSISRRIVEELGGTLYASNHGSGGAVFTLDLAAYLDTEE